MSTVLTDNQWWLYANIRKRECDLIQIGGLLDEKGYGIAGSTGNPLISVISNVILKLQQYGEIQGNINKVFIFLEFK